MSCPDTVFLKWARRLDPVAVFSGQVVAWLIIPMVLALNRATRLAGSISRRNSHAPR